MRVRRSMLLWAFVCLLLLCFPQPVLAANAKAAVVIEQSSGRVLFAQNENEPLPMASTTKIMTALVAIEQGNLADVVAIDPSCVGIEGSSAYLEAGEKLTLEDLLYALMLVSGNDAAEAIALHVGGNRQNFIVQMNETAKGLNLTQTHFENPHGLPAEGHQTTALELAQITRRAYAYESFRTIVSTVRKKIPWQGRDYDRVLTNKNKMLRLYEGANGVKTGYTKKAGRCLVSGARRNGMQLICVVLGCPDMWNESMALLDTAFEQYEMVDVLDSLLPACSLPVEDTEESVSLLPAFDVALPLKADETTQVELVVPEQVPLPVARGQYLGYANISVNETLLYEVPLLADRDVSRPSFSAQYLERLLRVLQGWCTTDGFGRL